MLEDKTQDKKDEQLIKPFDVEVVGTDPMTGKKFNETVKIDPTTKEGVEAIKNFVRKGFRAEAVIGAENIRVRNMAKNLVTDVVSAIQKSNHENIQRMISAGKTKDEEGVKFPTQEEIDNDPQAIQKYTDKKIELAVSKIRDEFAEKENEKAKDKAEAMAFNDAIKDALAVYKLPVNTIIRAIKADPSVKPEGVMELCKELYQEIYGDIDPSMLSDEQKAELVKQQEEKAKAPKAPAGGSDHDKPEKPAKNIQEVHERERRKHGWDKPGIE